MPKVINFVPRPPRKSCTIRMVKTIEAVISAGSVSEGLKKMHVYPNTWKKWHQYDFFRKKKEELIELQELEAEFCLRTGVARIVKNLFDTILDPKVLASYRVSAASTFLGRYAKMLERQFQNALMEAKSKGPQDGLELLASVLGPHHDD